MRFSPELATKKPKQFSSSLTQRSTLIRSLPPSFHFMYNLSTSLFGCNAPYIVIVFLDFLSTSFNSLSFHCSIPAPHLNTATTHAFIAVTLFFQFSFDFRKPSFIFLYCFFFHFILFDLIQLNYAQICVSFLSTTFITSQFGSFILHI